MTKVDHQKKEHMTGLLFFFLYFSLLTDWSTDNFCYTKIKPEVEVAEAELGIEHLCMFLVCKYLNVLGAQVGALFSYYLFQVRK